MSKAAQELAHGQHRRDDSKGLCVCFHLPPVWQTSLELVREPANNDNDDGNSVVILAWSLLVFKALLRPLSH